MTIAFIGGRDIRTLGGIETYMSNLTAQLARMGHKPIVFCESDHNAEECINGVRVIFMTGLKSDLVCKPWVGLKATIFTIRRIKDIDAIHYNAWPPSLWSPLAALCGIKSVMQGHGHEWQRSKYSKTQQKILKLMEGFTAHLNRHLIMCSASQSRYFKAKYHRDSVTIPTAINLPAPERRDTDILHRFNLSPKRYFLFLGRLVQDKNPDCLIKAFKKAKSGGYRLVMAGDNPKNEAYVRHLRSLADIDADIVFTNAVYGDDKETLLDHAAAFCIPSTIEGLSISLLEAMSFRLPIIASDIEANREVLDADQALWVKAEDVDSLAEALRKFISEPDILRSQTESNYKKVCDNYTWPNVARKYINYLSGL